MSALHTFMCSQTAAGTKLIRLCYKYPLAHVTTLVTVTGAIRLSLQFLRREGPDARLYRYHGWRLNKQTDRQTDMWHVLHLAILHPTQNSAKTLNCLFFGIPTFAVNVGYKLQSCSFHYYYHHHQHYRLNNRSGTA